MVAVSGKLGAYDLATGKMRWSGAGGGGSYSSPHLATIDGVAQVVFLGGPGAIGVDPATGKTLWQHDWQGGAIVQPAITPEGDVLISAISMNGGEGLRRLAIARSGGAWTALEKWTSKGLKPYFNDYVIHTGYAYGFDNSILSCIDLADGSRKWKGGRYGNGQLLLLADQDLLLVISEEGELALVSATPDQFKEVAHAPALEGKTWNHPVLVKDVLLVRNDHGDGGVPPRRRRCARLAPLGEIRPRPTDGADYSTMRASAATRATRSERAAKRRARARVGESEWAKPLGCS